MIRSIATVSIGGTLDEKLRTIAAAGFTAVEIFENDFTCFDGSAGDVATMCSDLGLSICALQPFRDFEGMPEPHRRPAPCLTVSQTVRCHGGGVPVLESWRSIAARS